MERKKVIRCVVLWVWVLIVFMATGCDRSVHREPKVRLSLAEFLKSKVGAQELTRVVKVSINVRTPADGSLIVAGWEPLHHDGATTEAPPQDYIVSAKQGAGQIVQIIIVTESESGGTGFDYGDAVVNVQPGDNFVEITTTTLAESEPSAEAGVRYLYADGTGPTGPVDMLYQPPNGKPMMVVHELYAVGGWMNLHLFQTTPLQYRLRTTGEMLFGDVNFSHPDFVSSPTMVRMKHPYFYADRYHVGTPYEMFPPGEYFLGFAGPGKTGKVVCYDPDDNVDLPEAWLDSTGVVAFEWSGTSGDTGDLHRVSGGSVDSSGPCLTGTPFVDTLSAQIDYFGSRGGRGLFGFEGGFILHDGTYGPTPAQALYQERLGASQLSWKMLPGVFAGANAVSGVRVFMRYDPSHSDEYRFNDQIMCDQLQSTFGFSQVADLAGSSADSFLVTGLTYATVYDQQVVLCPYDVSGKYLNHVADEAYDIGQGVSSFGSGADGAITISSSLSDPASNTTVLGGKVLMAKRLVSQFSPDGRTISLAGGTLNSPSTEFEVGDEVIWMVIGEDGNNCGSELQAGQYGFNFVSDLDTAGGTLTLRAPLVLNGLAVTTAALTSADVLAGSGFCRIFVQRVPHFESLTLDASAGFRSIDTSAMQMNTSGGGVLAFRVKGALDFKGNNNFALAASGYGFKGGVWSTQATTGYGYLGYQNNYLSPVANAGGGFNLYGGGGGGGIYGSGGNGGSAGGTSAGGQGAPYSATLCGGSCDWNDFLLMGGGGGTGSQFLGDGGWGGGVVAIYAGSITRSSGTGLSIFRSDGLNGMNVSASGEDAGGGGGAGTVLVLTKSLDTFLSLYATGGPGGNATGPGSSRGGGGGGGGLIVGRACGGIGNFGAPDVAGGIPGTGTESPGAPGSSGTSDVNASTSDGFCWE
ncbi:MAG: hypothetical protein IT288_11885 [Bdellovibrionales bacterium]|nr:hypothetical protein [Bdellovibrionales bacterium]